MRRMGLYSFSKVTKFVNDKCICSKPYPTFVVIQKAEIASMFCLPVIKEFAIEHTCILTPLPTFLGYQDPLTHTNEVIHSRTFGEHTCIHSARYINCSKNKRVALGYFDLSQSKSFFNVYTYISLVIILQKVPSMVSNRTLFW